MDSRFLRPRDPGRAPKDWFVSFLIEELCSLILILQTLFLVGSKQDSKGSRFLRDMKFSLFSKIKSSFSLEDPPGVSREWLRGTEETARSRNTASVERKRR